MTSCRREVELLPALAEGRWPLSCEAELRDHVGRCESCSDLLAVAGALLEDRHQSEAGIDLPSSGAAWWRVQLRAEHEAHQKARRAVQWTYELSVGAIIVVMVAALAMTSLVAKGWHLLTTISLDSPMSLLSTTTLPLANAAIAGFIVVSFLALYLAVAGDRQ